jgi:site-specific DNA recombinase
MGVPPPSGKVTTTAWPCSTVSRILSSETYAGVWHYGKMKRGKKRIVNPKDYWIAVDVPAIVDRNAWEIAQERKKRNQADSRRNTKREYLLRSRVKCEFCGHKMGIIPPHPSRKYHYSRCTAAYAKHYGYNAECKNRKHYRGTYVDNFAWQWVCSFFLNPEKLEQGYEQYLLEKERKNAPSNQQLVIINDTIFAVLH